MSRQGVRERIGTDARNAKLVQLLCSAGKRTLVRLSHTVNESKQQRHLLCVFTSRIFFTCDLLLYVQMLGKICVIRSSIR
jgi:hypothetical protein